jgi:hypothetical protein
VVSYKVPKYAVVKWRFSVHVFIQVESKKELWQHNDYRHTERDNVSFPVGKNFESGKDGVP